MEHNSEGNKNYSLEPEMGLLKPPGSRKLISRCWHCTKVQF